MSETNVLNTGECQHISTHKPHWDDRGRVHWVDIMTQHESLNAKAHCFLPPTKVIPVIFLPGVMGSNLMSLGDKFKEDEFIWRGDSDIQVYLDWARLRGHERRALLNPDITVVDDRGKVSTDVYSLLSDNGKGAHGTLLPPREKRGWGEALNFSYGHSLSVLQAGLLDDWQKGLMRRVAGQNYVSDNPKDNGILRQLCGEKLNTEDKVEDVLTEKEVLHFSNFLFPVHVFGYNWLTDNAVSAANLLNYIDKVLGFYKHEHGHGLALEKVILVTHSMGGLVARYASQVLGGKDKILGIVHGVIPDLGSPAAYRRMKVGGRQEGAAGIVMGKSAEELMPVLARAAAPLQLLPAPDYTSDTQGAAWLRIKKEDTDGRDLLLPKNGDPFGDIYLNQALWWRLYESDIIDKDELVSQSNWEEYVLLMKNKVRRFIYKLGSSNYHPNSYVFYGNTKDSDGFLQWKITSITYPKKMHDSDKKIPNNYREILLPYNRSRIYKLEASHSPGDGTVPVESLKRIRRQNGQSIKSVLATDVDHQGAFDVKSLADIHHRPALKFTLRAIVKMVQEVPFTP